MKEIFKVILKYLFANTKLDEKVADVLETAKGEVSKLDKQFDDLKEEVEKEETPAEKETEEETPIEEKPKKNKKG